ncbi:MAG: RdgB/HAM1 family non-canonical purine NTP pyrophosphatase [Steroidobacteraceae bacterium]
MRVVLASGNPGKLRELERLLGPVGWELVPQGRLGIASAAETGSTFVENALLKARHAAREAAGAALADDSGIEVDALGGAPGIRSARYAGEQATDLENLEKLLAALDGTPPERRTARYRCVIAYVASAADPHPIVAEGCWEGSIATTARGHGGFGYDPIFIPGEERAPRGGAPARAHTAAELDPAEKAAVSHRSRALAAFLAQLPRR